jgi:RNA polymerase sigma-70 factor, ECF subfamily
MLSPHQLVEKVMTERHRGLGSYLRQFINNPSLIDDILQDVYLQIFLNGHKFDQSRDLGNWAYAVARNKAIDYIRRESRRRGRFEDVYGRDGDRDVLESIAARGDDLLDLEIRMDSFADLRRAVQSLPVSLRDAVDLVFLQGMPYKVAARRLSIPMGTVKSRISRALGLLREQQAEDVATCC